MQPVRCKQCKLEKKLLARGLCIACYNRAYKHGELGVRHRASAAETFFRSFERGPSNLCWLWKGAKLPTGYGALRGDDGETVRANRFAYQQFIGKIPSGKLVLHTCDVRLCVNPAHLRLGTYKDNSEDAVAKHRTAHSERHPQAKLTDAQVREIRALRGRLQQKEIAARFNISPSIVCQILKGQIWRHVT